MNYQSLGTSHIVYNDQKEAVECYIAVVSKDSVHPRFDKGGTQGRIKKQDNVIKDIVMNFNDNLIFGHNGSFQGLPVITQNGDVVIGNHRAEAFKLMESDLLREKYEKYFNCKIDNDCMIVRLLPSDIEYDIVREMAYISNIGRESTYGEKVLTNYSKYAENIASLPKYIDSENVDELQCMVARFLDKQSNGLELFETNLSLFCSVAGVDSDNRGIMEAIDAIHTRDPQKAKKIKDALIANAGNFYNISKSDRIPQIQIGKYITKAVFSIANSQGTKTKNFATLNQRIRGFLDLTEEGKKLSLSLNDNFFDDIKASVLGLSILKFVEQENPSQAFYLFLSNFLNTLEINLQPTFFKEGKPLKEANIYDALELFVSQGHITKESSMLVENMKELQDYENLQCEIKIQEVAQEEKQEKRECHNLFELYGIDLGLTKEYLNMEKTMTKSRLKNKLENHDYLNIGNSILFDMLTFKIDFNEQEFLSIINGMRDYVGLSSIDYIMPKKPARTKDEIMQDVDKLKFITSRFNSYLPIHQYLIKDKNVSRELYEELYSYIFYNFEIVDFFYKNYYKIIVWNGRQYWIMNSDIRYSFIINRNMGD